jgi:hypothetical protein
MRYILNISDRFCVQKLCELCFPLPLAALFYLFTNSTRHPQITSSAITQFSGDCVWRIKLRIGGELKFKSDGRYEHDQLKKSNDDNSLCLRHLLYENRHRSLGRKPEWLITSIKEETKNYAIAMAFVPCSTNYRTIAPWYGGKLNQHLQQEIAVEVSTIALLFLMYIIFYGRNRIIASSSIIIDLTRIPIDG